MSVYEKARQRTEQRILQAALTCVLQAGYSRLTVTAIANTADIGRGTFYQYFANVDAVLLAVIKQYFDDLQAATHAMMAHYESPEKEIRAWEMAYEHAEQLRTLVTILDDPQASDLAAQVQGVILEGFRESLALNAFAYPQMMQLPLDVMATFSAGAVFALMRRWLAGELVYTAAEMAQMTYKLLYHRAPEA